MPNDWLRVSCTYRDIHRESFFEGFAEGFSRRFPLLPDVNLLECHKAWLSCLGTKWLDPLTAEVHAKIDAIDDVSKLERLVEKLTDDRLRILTWDRLFASLEFPSTRRASLR
jgi:hypothetical protein